MVQRMVKEIDLGKDLEKVVTTLKSEYGDEFDKVSGDMWNALIDKAEAEANDKIKMLPKGQGVVAYGVLSWLSTWRCGRTKCGGSKLMEKSSSWRRCLRSTPSGP